MTQYDVGSWSAQPQPVRGASRGNLWGSHPWLTSSMFPRSDSGAIVTPETALGHTPLWHGLLLLGGDAGSLDIALKRQRGDEFFSDTTHTAYRLADIQSNGLMCANNFWEMMVPRAVLWGNALAEIKRNFAGRPLPVSQGGGMVPLPPAHTHPDFDDDGKLWIKTADISPQGKVEPRFIDPVDTFHLSSLSTDGFWGRRLTDVAKNRIGNGLGLQKQQNRIMDNRMMTDIALVWPHALDPEERLAYEERLREDNKGIENAGNYLLLDDGVGIHRLGMDLEKAQFDELIKLDIIQTASLLGIPAQMLNAMVQMTFNNTEESERHYINRTLRRWLNKIDKELRAKLLTDREQSVYHFEHDLDPLLQTKLSERYEAYSSAISSMWLNRNEVRQKEGLNPVEGLDEFVNPNTTSGAPNQALKAAELKAMMGREDYDVYAACRREDAVLDWLDDYYHGDFLKRLFAVVPRSAPDYCDGRLSLWRKISGHVKTQKSLGEIVQAQRQTIADRVAGLLTAEFLN